MFYDERITVADIIGLSMVLISMFMVDERAKYHRVKKE